MSITNSMVIKKKNSCTILGFTSLSELFSVTVFADRDLGGLGCEAGPFALVLQIYARVVFARRRCSKNTPDSTRPHNSISQCFFASGG